jgi:hypothetical protein
VSCGLLSLGNFGGDGDARLSIVFSYMQSDLQPLGHSGIERSGDPWNEQSRATIHVAFIGKTVALC